MTCTIPKIPPSNAEEAAKFAKKFAQQTSAFIKALKLPSALDPSVLGFSSKTTGYFVDELEDSDIVQAFIESSITNALKGHPSVHVDASAIIKDLSDIFNAFVAGAKSTPTFSGFSSASFLGKYGERDVIYKILLAVNTADATELYESDPKNVLELAYSAYLTVQKA